MKNSEKRKSSLISTNPTEQKNKNHNGLFLDGKSQAVDILRSLGPEHRLRIINQLKQMNQQLVNDLNHSSTPFEFLDSIDPLIIKNKLNSIPLKIIGMALKKTNGHLQRKILRILRQDQAKEVYKTMTTFFDNEDQLSLKAQEKILQLFFVQ